MPLYHFALRDGERSIPDPDAIDLTDSATAREYASQVAREIMKAREVERRHWKIAVQDDAGTAVSEVLFATVDPTLDHLPRYQRTELERLAGNVAALKAIAYESRLLVLRSRAIMARLSRRPVARKGRQAARPSRPLCSWFALRGCGWCQSADSGRIR